MNEPTAVKFIPLNSSMFESVAYNPDHGGILTLKFKNGLVKAYQQVSEEVFAEFMSADSQGTFYNANMKGRYESLVVAEAVKKPLKVAGEEVAPDADLSQAMAGHISGDSTAQPVDLSGVLEPQHTQRTSKIDGQPLGGRVNPPTWDEVGSGKSVKKVDEFYTDNESEVMPSETGGSGTNRGLRPSEYSAVTGEHRAVETSADFVEQDCYVHMGMTPHWKRPDGSLVCSLCHPKPSTEKSPQDGSGATSEKPAGVMTVPQVLAPVEPPKTPAEAIRLLTEQDGLIQATIAKSREIAQDAMAVRVTDPKSYTDAGERLKFLAECQDRAVKFLDPIRAMLLRPYQMAQERLKAAKEPLDTAMAHIKRQRIVWSDAEEQKRLAEQERQRREAEAAAEEERKARGEQMTLGAVDEALAQGDTATAEKLIAEPIQAPGEYVPPAFVESAVPETKGVSKRSNWKAEVVNLEDLVLDIASGICSLRDGKGLAGHAPLTFLKVNETTINQAAKSQQKAMSYPGLKAFNDASEAVRRKK